MKRALFLLHFRRTLTIFGSVFVLFGLFSHLALWVALRMGISDVDAYAKITDGMLIGLMVFLAVPLGASTFSSDFKEKHGLFFYSLPLPLRTTWAVLTGANFAAMLATLALLILVRPGLVSTWMAQGWLRTNDPHDQLGLWTLGLFLILCLGFAAGNCFALCVRRDLLVYLLAFPSAILLTGGIPLLATLCGWWQNSPTPHPGPALSGLGAATVMLAMLSLRFFAPGEVNLTRGQLRHLGTTLGAMAGLIVVLAAAIDVGLFVHADPWIFEGYESQVSADGNYLSVVERRESHPQFARVSILDLRTGKTLRRLELRGMMPLWRRDAAWTQIGADHRLIFKIWEDGIWSRILPSNSSELLAISTNESDDRHWRFGKVRDFEALAGGKVLVGFADTHSNQLVLLDTGSGERRELWRADLDLFERPGDFEQWRVEGEQVLLAVTPGDAPPSIWRLNFAGNSAGSKTIPFSGVHERSSNPCVVDDIAYSPLACKERLKDRYSLPRDWRPAAREPSGFLRPNVLIPSFDEKTPVFYARQGAGDSSTLMVWSPRQKAWATVAAEVETQQVGFAGRLVVYAQKSPGGFDIFLYDADREKTIALGTVQDPQARRPLIHLATRGGEENIDVDYGGTIIPALRGRYIARSGTAINLPKAILESKWRELLYGDESGNWIVETVDAIVRWNADGSKVRLWPPGS